VATSDSWEPVPTDGDLAAIARRDTVAVERIPPPDSGFTTNIASDGEVVAGDQFAPGWRVLTGGDRTTPHRAFGWAMAAAASPPSVSFTYTDQWMRTAEMALLGLLWLAALWITRRPGSA